MPSLQYLGGRDRKTKLIFRHTSEATLGCIVWDPAAYNKEVSVWGKGGLKKSVCIFFHSGKAGIQGLPHIG